MGVTQSSGAGTGLIYFPSVQPKIQLNNFTLHSPHKSLVAHDASCLLPSSLAVILVLFCLYIVLDSSTCGCSIILSAPLVAMDFSLILGTLFSILCLMIMISLQGISSKLELVVVTMTHDKTIDLLESVLSVSPLFFGQYLSFYSHANMQLPCWIISDLINLVFVKSYIFRKQCMGLLEAFESTRKTLTTTILFYASICRFGRNLSIGIQYQHYSYCNYIFLLYIETVKIDVCHFL